MARKAASPRGGKASRAQSRFEALSVGLGDKIRVERRFVVDGQMSCVADRGVFHGIQAMGSIEHILLETKGEVRLIPIPSISEIVLEHAEQKREAQQATQQQGAGFDPSFA
jgi:hypothetical protein